MAVIRKLAVVDSRSSSTVERIMEAFGGFRKLWWMKRILRTMLTLCSTAVGGGKTRLLAPDHIPLLPFRHEE